MSLLSLQSLYFTYASNPVLKNIQGQFNAGEMVGLVGPNGAGKSTLMQLIMGSIKADRGLIQLHQKDLAHYSKRALAQHMALVPQDTHMDYAFSVEDVVAMGRNPHLNRFQPATALDLAWIDKALKQTQLTAMAKRAMNTLSGGERQRVFVARAIAQQTPIVLFDEATANLDICHQLDVLSMARQLANEGRLVICAIHDLSMAARFFDRLLLLADQHIQADGPPSQVLTTENLRHYFSIEAEIQYQEDRLQINPVRSLHSIN